MKGEIEIALAPLQGLVVWGPARAADMLTLQLGDPRVDTSPMGRRREVGEYALHVQCPWRLTEDTLLIAGSGDLFTPATSDVDRATFEWDVVGATWWDYRLREFFGRPAPIWVERIAADPFGGFRLSCSGGVSFEVFPNTSAAPHDDSEYWRLLQTGDSTEHFVVRASSRLPPDSAQIV